MEDSPFSSRLLILIGPPACGKGTQAGFLEKRLGMSPFSTGVAIRRHVREGTELGKRFAKMLGSAYLLPDETTLELVREELRGQEGGLVLDGFPRTLPQGELFDTYCVERRWRIDGVISFEAEREQLKDRVLTRLSCTHCGGTYRDGSDGMHPESPCPRCGMDLERRADDTAEVFEERYSEFERLTAPLIDYYAPRGIVHKVPAFDPAPVTAEKIAQALGLTP